MSSPGRSSSVTRIALEEVASRERNEQVVPSPEAGWDLGLVERACECGDSGCREQIRLTVAEYEELRAHGRRFAVAHGHVMPVAENVVERRPRYTVVEKIAEAAVIAEARDPRP